MPSAAASLMKTKKATWQKSLGTGEAFVVPWPVLIKLTIIMTKRFSSPHASRIATPKVGANLSQETSTFQSITDMNTSRYLIHPFQPSSPPKSDYPDEKCIRLQTLFSKKKNFLLLDFSPAMLVFWLRICRLILSRLVLVSCCEEKRRKKEKFVANKLNFGRSTGGVIADILRLMGWRIGRKKFAQVFSSVRYIFANQHFTSTKKYCRKWRRKSRKTKNVRKSCRWRDEYLFDFIFLPSMLYLKALRNFIIPSACMSKLGSAYGR